MANCVEWSDAIAQQECRDGQRRDEYEPGVSPKLLVLTNRYVTAQYGSILQRKVRAGREHEYGDDPVDGWTCVSCNRQRMRRDTASGHRREGVTESIVR